MAKHKRLSPGIGKERLKTWKNKAGDKSMDDKVKNLKPLINGLFDRYLGKVVKEKEMAGEDKGPLNTATCSTCGHSYDPNNIPDTHPYRHPVNGGLVNAPEEQREPELESLSLPNDPILRLVLIEKGIIEVDDLTQAERKLKASGVAISNEETALAGLKGRIADAQRGR